MTSRVHRVVQKSAQHSGASTRYHLASSTVELSLMQTAPLSTSKWRSSTFQSNTVSTSQTVSRQSQIMGASCNGWGFPVVMAQAMGQFLYNVRGFNTDDMGFRSISSQFILAHHKYNICTSMSMSTIIHTPSLWASVAPIFTSSSSYHIIQYNIPGEGITAQYVNAPSCRPYLPL